MNKYRIYSLIGKILSLEFVPSHREAVIHEIQQNDIPWEKIVAMADHHLVLQALYPKIRDNKLEEYFPEEVTIHLKYIFELTTSRNLEVIKQAEKINSVLLGAGIKPVFMKGVGNILDGLYRYPGERILHDIDILVPENVFEKAADVLINDGYRSNYTYNANAKAVHRHYPILFKDGEPIYVELHRMAVDKKYNRFFNGGMIFASARKPVSSADCLVMSDKHNVIHNFLHAQMDHQAHIYAREFMRNLYDLLLLSGRIDPAVVLNEFGHYRRNAAGYLDICYDTFRITPAKRIEPRFFIHFYRFRYKLYMKSRFAGAASLIALRFFFGYVVKPLKAVSDKELRVKLWGDIRNPIWYKKQFGFYRRVLGFHGKKS
jgi:hypothetical protein